MATGEEKPKKEEGKGFSGLSSLVSDVDTLLLSSAKPEATAAPVSSSPDPSTTSQDASPPAPPRQRQYPPVPPVPHSGGSAGKWLMGIAAVIGVFWLIGQAGNQSSSGHAGYSPSAQSESPTYQAPPSEPEAPSRPEEARPPIGRDLVFTTAQINYCVAEDIRMDGAKSALDSYRGSDVDQFNAMVADYNSRCGSFRYRRGALKRAKEDMEPYRSQLQTEGSGRFTRGLSTGPVSTPGSPRHALDAIVQATIGLSERSRA